MLKAVITSMWIVAGPQVTLEGYLVNPTLDQWYWEGTVPTPVPGQWLAAPDSSPRDPEYLRCPWGLIPINTESGLFCIEPNALGNPVR